jgi:hypothetical protein
MALAEPHKITEPLRKLQAGLLRRGLPEDYVKRAVQELADHHADLREAQQPGMTGGEAVAWQELGDVDRLGDELVRKYHARSFAGRHPLLTFVVAPLPTILAMWSATFVGFWLAVWGVLEAVSCVVDARTWADAEPPPLVEWVLMALQPALFYVPPAVVAWSFCRTARRSGRGPAWGAASCLLLALLAMFVVFDLRGPHDGQAASLMVGLWSLGFSQKHLPITNQLLHMAAPLAVGMLAIWQTRRREIAPFAVS